MAALPPTSSQPSTPRGAQAALDPIEVDRLVELEAVIDEGLQTFGRVAVALLEIRDHRLYRATHKTFETYLRDRWNISRSYAHRVIEAGEIVAMLPMGNKPTSERVTRELAPLKHEPEKLAEAWGQAIVATDTPTAEVVRRVVARVTQDSAPAVVVTSVEPIDKAYVDLFAKVSDPRVRDRLGERLNAEKMDGDYPPGRLRAIATEYGTTVEMLKRHVRFWEMTFDTARRMEWFATRTCDNDVDEWVSGFAQTYREIIAGIPADHRKKLRAHFRMGIKAIEAFIEALK